MPEMVQIREGELLFKVALLEGQKTGFYLDQRDHRQLVLRISRNKKVLDCFCYSGGFGIAALKGGAHFVKAVDTSEKALLLAQENLLLNGLPQDKFYTLKADVFEFLRIRRPPRSTPLYSSAASDVYKRQPVFCPSKRATLKRSSPSRI